MLRLAAATAEQRDQLADIVRSVMREHGLDPSGPEVEAELAGIPGAYRAAGGEFFAVLDQAGRLAGTLGLKADGPRGCELTRMYLLPQYRGRGEGAGLLRQAMTLAARRGFDVMELETAPAFRAALRLYRRHGFVAIPQRPGNSQCSLRFRRTLEQE